MSAVSGRTTVPDELRLVVAHILDTAAMGETIASLLEPGMTVFAKEVPEIDGRFPGFTERLRRRIGKETQATMSRRISGLRQEMEGILAPRLTPSDIEAALRFQRHRISGQLRDPAFIRSLEADNPGGARLSERMSARMTAEQHAFVADFVQSPCGVKLASLAPQIEALKYDWMQSVAAAVESRLPVLGSEILQRHYARPTRR